MYKLLLKTVPPSAPFATVYKAKIILYLVMDWEQILYLNKIILQAAFLVRHAKPDHRSCARILY